MRRVRKFGQGLRRAQQSNELGQEGALRAEFIDEILVEAGPADDQDVLWLQKPPI